MSKAPKKPHPVDERDNELIARAAYFNVHTRVRGEKSNQREPSLIAAAKAAQQKKKEGLRPLVYAISHNGGSTFVNPDILAGVIELDKWANI